MSTEHRDRKHQLADDLNPDAAANPYLEDSPATEAKHERAMTKPQHDEVVRTEVTQYHAEDDAPREKPRPTQLEKNERSAAASTWFALIAGAILLILLLIFVAQNTHSVELHLAGYQFSFPLGIGILLSAVAGALIMSCVGAWRMFELNRQLKKTRRELQQAS